MAQRFIECDREQAFLMPPSVRDWLPEDHLAWFMLASAEELDLSAFYADYRSDGHGRPAHDPQMMVALLLYAYAKGQRGASLHPALDAPPRGQWHSRSVLCPIAGPPAASSPTG